MRFNIVAVFLLCPAAALAQQFQVNTTTDGSDAWPTDLVCDTRFNPTTVPVTPRSGLCTLRAAIESANQNPGRQDIFILPAGIIQPTSSLPSIVDPVYIGAPGTTSERRWIDGALAPGGYGLHIQTGARGTQVHNIAVTNFLYGGIYVGADSVRVTGVFAGLTPSGARGQNGHGVVVENADDVVLGGTRLNQRNVFSANTTYGVYAMRTRRLQVIANYVGTDTTGDATAGNFGTGIYLHDSDDARIGDSTADHSRRNVISGNGGEGIHLVLARNTKIMDNFIGVGASGMRPVGNAGTGIVVRESYRTQIGPATTRSATLTSRPTFPRCGAYYSELFAGNVISANGSNGISVRYQTSQGTTIAQNRIGTDSSGRDSLGNRGVGIVVEDAPDVLIGGAHYQMGNVISANRMGINISGQSAAGTWILGNSIGTDILGDTALGNGTTGILVDDAPLTEIGGTSATSWDCNLVSGNGSNNLGHGIQVRGTQARATTIQGNFIGVNGGGYKPLGNAAIGISIDNAPRTVIGGENVAAAQPFAGNVVSANRQAGIDIRGDSAAGTRIIGNHVGTNHVARELRLPSGNPVTVQGTGIHVNNAPDVIIGDTLPGHGNVIAGGNDNGVVIAGPKAVRTRVRNNLIGTGDGVAALGNKNAGIVIHEAPDNEIGDSTGVRGLPHGNVISGNEGANRGAGVQIEGDTATGNRVRGNLIGTQRDGTSPLPNRFDGVFVLANASRNMIGGPDTLHGNVIAFNERSGVNVAVGRFGRHPVGNGILSNSIHSNERIGIDLNNDSVTASPRRDSAGLVPQRGPGPNRYQAAPYLFTLPDSGVGILNTDSAAKYTIQIFSSPEGDTSGYGQGKTLLRSFSVTTNTAGFASFPLAAAPAGHVVSATATDSSNNTSEFSRLACDEGSPVYPGLTLSNVEWRDPGNTYTGSGMAKPVIPVRADGIVQLSVLVTQPSPDPGITSAWVIVTARNLHPSVQQTPGAVYREQQPLDQSGAATLSISVPTILRALAAAPNTNIIEANVRVCYRGKIVAAVSSNYLQVVRERLIAFLPGVLGSEIDVDINGTGTTAFPPSVPFPPINGTDISRLAFDPQTLLPRYRAHALRLFTTYWGLVTVYSIETPFNTARASAALPAVTYSGSPPIEFFQMRPWPYDWRLRLDRHIETLQGNATGPGLGFTSPSITAMLADARANSRFMHDRVALAGHSTGGLIIKGALGPRYGQAFSSLVDRAYFINTPFTGAPKAYYALMTGEMVDGILPATEMRQIAPFLPITYYLSPAPGYQDPNVQNIVMRYPHAVTGTLQFARRRDNARSAAPFMDSAIVAAGNRTRWIRPLGEAADSFHRENRRVAPVIGWRNSRVYYGTLQGFTTPGSVRVNGVDDVVFITTRGDGTVPLSSLAGAPNEIPGGSRDTFALGAAADERLEETPGAPATRTVVVEGNDVVHDQAANNPEIWRKIIAHLLEPDKHNFTGVTPVDSVMGVTFTLSGERTGARETARYARRLNYDTILSAAVVRPYAQGHDGLYCDGQVVPHALRASPALWYACDGTLVVVEAKGGYRYGRPETMLQEGYGWRQATPEWARRGAEVLLVNAPAGATAQRQAAWAYLRALEYGAAVRMELFHAEYQIARTRRYQLFSWRP